MLFFILHFFIQFDLFSDLRPLQTHMFVFTLDFWKNPIFKSWNYLLVFGLTWHQTNTNFNNRPSKCIKDLWSSLWTLKMTKSFKTWVVLYGATKYYHRLSYYKGLLNLLFYCSLLCFICLPSSTQAGQWRRARYPTAAWLTDYAV